MIDKICIDEYLRIVGKSTLDERIFEIVSLMPSLPAERLHKAENTPVSPDFSECLKYKEIYQLSPEELNRLIELYSEEEKAASHKKGRRYIKKKRIAAEKELEKREMEKKL